MTGGGQLLNAGGPKVRHGFELHCDASQEPNNLVVTWSGGKRFRLTELVSASCSDDPDIEPNPRGARFDTYRGAGRGLSGGASGAVAEWTVTDTGQPGGYDFFDIVITDSDGTVILDVSGNLDGGNHQAHEK